MDGLLTRSIMEQSDGRKGGVGLISGPHDEAPVVVSDSFRVYGKKGRNS